MLPLLPYIAFIVAWAPWMIVPMAAKRYWSQSKDAVHWVNGTYGIGSTMQDWLTNETYSETRSPHIGLDGYQVIWMQHMVPSHLDRSTARVIIQRRTATGDCIIIYQGMYRIGWMGRLIKKWCWRGGYHIWQPLIPIIKYALIQATLIMHGLYHNLVGLLHRMTKEEIDKRLRGKGCISAFDQHAGLGMAMDGCYQAQWMGSWNLVLTTWHVVFRKNGSCYVDMHSWDDGGSDGIVEKAYTYGKKQSAIKDGLGILEWNHAAANSEPWMEITTIWRKQPRIRWHNDTPWTLSTLPISISICIYCSLPLLIW